jgi:hypothetical protein
MRAENIFHCFSANSMQQSCLKADSRSADKDPAICGTWRFITVLTRVSQIIRPSLPNVS